MVDVATRVTETAQPPQRKRSRKALVVAGAVVVVLIVALVGFLAFTKKHDPVSQTPAVKVSQPANAGSGAQNGGSGGAAQRVVPDTSHPTPGDLAGAWFSSCNGVKTQANVESDAMVLSQGTGIALTQLSAGSSSTKATVLDAGGFPGLSDGAVLTVAVQGGKLVITHNGARVASLWPTSETNQSVPGC